MNLKSPLAAFSVENYFFIVKQTNHHIMKGRRSRTDYVPMYVCMYPSCAHSFGPIGMKLGMDTPWDPGSVIG